jgi:hypothetical protein
LFSRRFGSSTAGEKLQYQLDGKRLGVVVKKSLILPLIEPLLSFIIIIIIICV